MFTLTPAAAVPTLGQKMLREAAFASVVAVVFVGVRRICIGK